MDNKTKKLHGDVRLPFFELFKRNVLYLKPEMPKFIIALVLILLNVVFDIILPLIIGQITGGLTDDISSTNVNTIITLSITYFLIGLVSQIVLYIDSMLLQTAGQNIVYKLRNDVFTHIESLSQNQFDNMPVGALVTRVCSYTHAMSDLFTNVLVNLLKNSLTVFGVYAMLIFISPMLALIMLVFVVIVFVTSFIFRRIVSKIFINESQYLSDLNTYLSENLSGMKITQLYNQEERKFLEFTEKNENLRRARYKVVIAFGVYRPFITLLSVLANATVFGAGVLLGLNAASIVSFYLLMAKFFNPIQEIADQLNKIQKAFSASERLFNLMDVIPDVIDREDAIELNEIKGKIEFKNVWFAYNDENWILKDVSFIANPGETVAFVGATGAGKTTILGLIVRNYEIQKGQILIDDIDIRNIKIDSLRKLVGQMLQDVFLFSGTIKDNITLFDDKFSDEEIKNACEYVNAYEVINKQENGINSTLIERGENLSQGERQLLSFARTVLHKPQILILDEATANIDTQTEAVIQDSLEKIKNIGTMLVVAHRLSTIQHADNIIVLQYGKIIESGTHNELLMNKGYYYKLYELQFNNRN